MGIPGHALSPKNCPIASGNLHPQVIHGSLSPPKHTIQTTSQLVQVFLHSSLQSVPKFYNGPPLSPNIDCYIGAMWTPSNTCFLGPTRVHTANGILIGSTIFAQLTESVPALYNGPSLRPLNCCFHGDLDTRLIHGSLGPLEPTSHTA